MAAKTTKSKRPKTKKETPTKETETKKTGSKKKSFLTKEYKIALTVIIVAGLLYYFRSFFVAALVNGRPISRLAIVGETENRYGATVLEEKISTVLVEQEMSSRGTSITPEEVDSEIASIESDIEASGQTLDEVLTLQGMTRADLSEQVRLRLAIDKMFGKDVTVTDEDIDNYLEENADFLPEDMSEEDLRDTARDQLTDQQISVEFQTWLQEARESANINYFKNY